MQHYEVFAPLLFHVDNPLARIAGGAESCSGKMTESSVGLAPKFRCVKTCAERTWHSHLHAGVVTKQTSSSKLGVAIDLTFSLNLVSKNNKQYLSNVHYRFFLFL